MIHFYQSVGYTKYPMIPRCIVIGDPHFRVSNIEEVEVAMKETIRLVSRTKPTFVVILGDILHTHSVVHTQAHKRACTWIEALSHLCHVYLIIGNHDYINNTQFLTEEHIFVPLKLWPNVTVVDHVVAAHHDGCLFVFCPYVPPGRFIEALNTCPKNWKSARCIFAHQEFKGCRMDDVVSKTGDLWTLEYPPVVSGHIHETQVLGNVYYPGSLMQHSFGDTSKKRILLLEFYADSGYAIQKFRLHGIKTRKTIDTTYTDLVSNDLIALTKKHLLRVLVTCTEPQKNSFKKSREYRAMMTAGIKIKIIVPATSDDRLESRKAMASSHHGFSFILDKLITEKDPMVQYVYTDLKTKGLL